MFVRHSIFAHMLRDADGAPAGTAAPAATTTPAAGTTTTTPAATTTPVAFSWDSAGLDAESMAVVNDRQWKGVPDVVTSYRNLEKLVGVPPERIIKLPGDKDPSDSWNAVYDRLGRPKAATDYKIPLPEGDKGDFAKAMAPIFHEAGLSQAQVQKLAEKTNAHVAEQMKAQTTASNEKIAADLTALKADWGNKYDENAAVVDNAAKAFGMTADHLTALKAAMGPRAAMKFLHNIGSKLGVEAAFVDGGKGNPPGFEAMTPEIAKGKIEQLKSDKAFTAQFISQDPKVRGDARQKMDALHKIAFG